MKALCVLAACAAVLAGSARAAAPACSAYSPAFTTALVELYTSEGCDTCPPADHWLSSLFARGFRTEQVVPLALHVDYWDYIGWKDPYAKSEFSRRQHKLLQMGRAPLIYTPQVVLQGRDFRRWGTSEFDDAVAHINAAPARARIRLSLQSMTRDAATVALVAELLDPARQGNAALYVAAYENKLASDVSAGENRGRRLEHDFVVREWVGPIGFGAGAKIEEKRSLPLLPNAVPAHSGVAAFVQDRSTGEVLQALMLPACRN
jgi:hypothetical protein